MDLKAKSALCVLMSVLLCVCLAACDKNGGAGDTSLAGSEPRRESENLYAADLSSGESTASSADGSQQNSSLPGSSGALAGNSSKKTASNKTTSKTSSSKTTTSSKAAVSSPQKTSSSATKPAGPSSTTSQNVDGGGYTASQQRILQLVNAERESRGLPALKLHAALCDAAQLRSREIVSNFSHTRPDGTSCFTVLKQFSITGYAGAGENIAMGSGSKGTAESIMNGWMNSDGHRANILGDFTYLGVGHYTSGNSQYWVQLFMR